MIRDTFLYSLVAIICLGVIAGIPVLLGFDPSRGLILAVILYFALGTYVVFNVCGKTSRHPIGQATLGGVVRNIWWTAWWPWFLWQRLND